MSLRAFLVAVALVSAGPLVGSARAEGTVADPSARGALQLVETLQIDDVIGVMRDEGLVYGREMAAEMFDGQGSAGWDASVALIYDAGAMRRRFDAAFLAALGGSAAVAEMEAFFASPVGQRALELEIAARRTLLDPAAEEAAKQAFSEMEAAGDARLAALRDFVAVNDLIESNVMGALNANLAFFQGMAEGSGEAMPEDQMLSDVWAQEPEIRAETTDWLFPYLALAYKPLSDADLAAYQAFSETPAGQGINAALFAAFDAVFVAISRDLGRAAARQMQGLDL